jgi:hypothetical protein
VGVSAGGRAAAVYRRLEVRPPRIPGSRVVYINGHPAALTDAEVAGFAAKKPGKLKRAADRAWQKYADEHRRESGIS